MRTQLFARLSARQLHIYKGLNLPRHFPARSFHASTRYQVVKPFLLADIGEGEMNHISQMIERSDV